MRRASVTGGGGRVAAVDEIVAAYDGDWRGVLRALMLLNERLELRLEQMSEVHPPHQRCISQTRRRVTTCVTNAADGLAVFENGVVVGIADGRRESMAFIEGSVGDDF